MNIEARFEMLIKLKHKGEMNVKQVKLNMM